METRTVRIRDLITQGVNLKKPSLDDILRVTCYVTGAFAPSIIGTSRKQGFCQVRHAFCAVAHRMGFHEASIGPFIKRDRSTVLHSLDAVDMSDELQELVQKILAPFELWESTSNKTVRTATPEQQRRGRYLRLYKGRKPAKHRSR